jgi:hypothetical protein
MDSLEARRGTAQDSSTELLLSGCQPATLAGSPPLTSRHENAVLPFAEFLQSHATVTVMSCWRPLPHPCRAHFQDHKDKGFGVGAASFSCCVNVPHSSTLSADGREPSSPMAAFISQQMAGTDPSQGRLVGRAWATAAETSPPAIWLLPKTARTRNGVNNAPGPRGCENIKRSTFDNTVQPWFVC